MQVEQIVLFIAVAALALALVLIVVAPRLRGGASGALRGRAAKGAPDEAQAVTGKSQPAFVAPAPVPPVPPPPPPVRMVCPTCRRQYAAGLRFCPYDARVLTSDAPAPGAGLGATLPADGEANAGKICPSCARRYDAVAMVCGRDGSALVSVN